MPAWVAPAAITGANMFMNALAGDSPQEKYYKWLEGELAKPWVAQGMTQAERANLTAQVRRMYQKEARTQRARTTASDARRGVSPNVTAMNNARVGTAYATAFGQSQDRILGEHLNMARTNYSQLRNQMPGVAANTPGNDQGFIGGNIMNHFLMKDLYKNMPQGVPVQPGFDTGTNMQGVPVQQGYPPDYRYGGGRYPNQSQWGF